MGGGLCGAGKDTPGQSGERVGGRVRWRARREARMGGGGRGLLGMKGGGRGERGRGGDGAKEEIGGGEVIFKDIIIIVL